MAERCIECGNKLSIFSTSSVCKKCSKLFDEKYVEIKNDVSKNFDLKEEQANFLKNKFEKDKLLGFYNEIYNLLLLSNKELKRNDLEFLIKIRDSFDLSDEDIGFNERIRPYVYINTIKEKNELPGFKLKFFGFNIVLKENERFHFADAVILNEVKTKNFESSGERSGVNFRIMNEVVYAVGTHKGILMNEDRLVKTSKGVLAITNQRLLLNPVPGCRPLSISLDKILSFQAYQNGIEVYKEDRGRGFFFETDNAGSVEVFGICLSFLLLGVS
jgi:hypothetical protein